MVGDFNIHWDVPSKPDARRLKDIHVLDGASLVLVEALRER